jgi:hypothetical protein
MKRFFQVMIFFLVLCMGQAACKKPPTKTKKEVMQERLTERMARWREGVERNCRDKVMETASAIADSTMLSNARSSRDSSGLPPIPGRPNRPDFRPPEDSLEVKPIFDKNAAKDSLKKEEGN